MQVESKLGLGYKVPFVLALLLMLALLGISGSSYYQSTSIAEKKVIELEQSKFELLKHEISGVLTEHKKIIMALRDTPPVEAILRAQASGGIDPESGDSLVVWMQRLNTIFYSFLRNQVQYLQIGYFDTQGKKIVDVNVYGENISSRPVSPIQAAAQNTYLLKTLDLESGQVYLSDVSPDWEQSAPLDSLRPVFRITTPVYDAEGKIKGFILIKLAAEYVFGDVNSGQGAERYVVDQRGNYVKHSDRKKLFGLERGIDSRFHLEQPELSKLASNQDYKVYRDADKDQIVGFQKIYLDAVDRSRYWMIVLHVPEEVVFADIRQSLNGMIRFSLLISVVSLILIIVLIARKVVRPILELANAARLLQAGNLSVRVDESEVKDELRVLYSAVNSFAERQQNATENLEKEIEAKTTRLSTIINNVVDGIITINARGIVTSFNPAAEKMFGYKHDEVIGKNIKILMPEPHSQHHDGYLKDYLKTGNRQVIGIGREVEGLRKNGKTFPLDLAVSEVNIDNDRHFIGMTRDITERKRVESLQKDFISTVSHELRTPLTSISGSLGLILGGVAGEISEKAKALLAIANNNSERLIYLINDILDIEKISSGQMQFDFKSTDLVAVVKQSIEANRGYGEKLDVSFEFNADVKHPVMVNIDEKRIAQVMSNLLSNAAKYSPTHDKVEIKLEKLDKCARISVHDNGKGIPDEFRSQIFQKFSQADSSDTREKGGTGLGLNISKAIVTSHSGTIGFESEEGQGTTFFVDLPLLADQEAIEEVRKQPLVLIVETNKDVSGLLSKMLKKAGYRFHQAFNFKEAAYLIERHEYDAVMLSLIDGAEEEAALFGDLGSQENSLQLPVVVVSTKSDAVEPGLNNSMLKLVGRSGDTVSGNELIKSISSRLGQKVPERARILHVEDDLDIVTIVGSLLRDDFSVCSAKTLKQARECIAKESFDLVLLDVGLPDGSGLDLLPELEQGENDTPVVIFSAQDMPGEIKSQVKATLIKSKTDNEKLVLQIDSAINRKAG